MTLKTQNVKKSKTPVLVVECPDFVSLEILVTRNVSEESVEGVGSEVFNMCKLRCRNDQRLLAELNWSIMAMAVAELFALKEQMAKQPCKSRAKKQVADPSKRSLAQTMRAIRGCMRDREGIPEPGQELSALLANAVTDSYIRKKPKAERYRPSKPNRKPVGAPKVRKITAQEKKQAKKIEAKWAA